MTATARDTVDPERAAPDHEDAALGGRRGAATPVFAPCLRVVPESPLPSDFDRAVMDTAAHARYDGRCEDVLRAKCRRYAAAGGSLLAFAALLAYLLSSAWLAAVPAALALFAAWRWAVTSAAADELRTETMH